LPLAATGKTTGPKTGIASNILDAISQGNESQRALEKCIAYSPPFGDYIQVNDSQVMVICRKVVPLCTDFTDCEITIALILGTYNCIHL
jgi:hypothetical protein